MPHVGHRFSRVRPPRSHRKATTTQLSSTCTRRPASARAHSFTISRTSGRSFTACSRPTDPSHLAAIDVTDARAGMWAVIDRRPRHPRPGPRHRSTHPQTDPRPHPRLPTTRRQMRKLTRKQALDANNVSGHLPTMSRDITAWSRLVSNQRPSACEAAVNAVDLRRKHFRALNGERLTCFDAYESLLHRT